MNTTDEKRCSECAGALKRIQMIDKVLSGHSCPEYAVGEAERNFWTARFPVEGRIASYMCDECGQITLYGESKSK